MRHDGIESDLARRILAPPALSEVVRQQARLHITDTIGVMLAGAPEPCTRAVFACASRGSGVRSLVSGERMPMRDAALCNGVSGHAHDFDDDEPHGIVGHPSVAVVAALMALADRVDLTMGSAIEAYAVGTETMLRIGERVNPWHYSAGWHCTASLGVFGAAAACAQVMGLSEADTPNALSIAATFAAGLRENFGTDGKPMQVGVAAANGIFACELALAGLRGAESAVGGRQGFLAMNRAHDVGARLAAFGDPWGIESPGFNVKIYPCCSSTHTALDALLALVAESGWSAEQIECVDVWIGADVPGILIHDLPKSGLEGKFSMRYCLAHAAVHGRVDLGAFTDKAVHDERTTAMLQRVRTHIDADLPRARTGVTHQSRVQITSRDGQRAVASQALPIGSAARPCLPEQLRAKFIGCVTHGADAASAVRVLSALDAMDDRDALHRILDAVHGNSGP